MKDFDVLGLIKVVVGVLTPAAVFYAIGYVITQAYVTTTGLQASFWFTESFYREAGARFLLDIVEAIALVPHLFIPLSALFIVLFPGDETHPPNRFSGPREPLRFRNYQVTREALFLLLVVLALTSIVSVLRNCAAETCASMIELPGWLFTSSWLLGGGQEKWLRQQPFLYPMAIFLAVAVPTVVTLGAWAYRTLWAKAGTGEAQRKLSGSEADGATSRATTHAVAAFFIAATFVTLMAYIPIGYGAFFYDFVVVSLVNKDKCGVGPEPSAETRVPDGTRHPSSQEKFMVVDCYLLGRFETRYILIGREVSTNPSIEAAAEETDHRIYIKQVEKLEPFAIESRHPIPLRSVTTPPIRSLELSAPSDDSPSDPGNAAGPRSK